MPSRSMSSFPPPTRLPLFAVALGCILACAIPAIADSEGSFQRTLRVTGSVNLDVATGSGTIEVRTGSSNEVRITGRIRVHDWFGGNADDKIKRLENNPPIEQNGNDIRIGHITTPSYSATYP